MKVFRVADSTPVSIDPKSFSGRVRSRRVASDAGGIPVHVYRVEFDAEARTHWHRHTGPQWLFIIAGRIRVQKWEEAAVDVGIGDAVMIEPGEKHWHGAAPGSAGSHLAVNINATTEWLERVSDEQYGDLPLT
jgi:quercetin dioxygenase-like cupin family protein